jgi:hypothetical protein
MPYMALRAEAVAASGGRRVAVMASLLDGVHVAGPLEERLLHGDTYDLVENAPH